MYKPTFASGQNLCFGDQALPLIDICDALERYMHRLKNNVISLIGAAGKGIIYGWTPVHYALGKPFLRNLPVAKQPDLHILEEHFQSTGLRRN